MKSLTNQIDAHIEEVGEMVCCLTGTNKKTQELLGQAAHALEQLSYHLKDSRDEVLEVKAEDQDDFTRSLQEAMITASRLVQTSQEA